MPGFFGLVCQGSHFVFCSGVESGFEWLRFGFGGRGAAFLAEGRFWCWGAVRFRGFLLFSVSWILTALVFCRFWSVALHWLMAFSDLRIFGL